MVGLMALASVDARPVFAQVPPPPPDTVRPARPDSSNPATLGAVTVAGEAAVIPEFEARRAKRLGRYMTRADLEKEDGKRMGDVLARMPGMRVVRGAGGRAWATASRGVATIVNQPGVGDRIDRQQGAREACYSDVYVDRALVYSTGGMQPLFDLGGITSRQIEAIEFYAGGGAQMPPEFNKTGAACGVLVIWMRISR
jgi:hypothetical protein